MKKPQIEKILGWDALNKSAILITLATGIPAMFSYFGAQSLTTVLLIAVSVSSFVFAIYRSYKIKKYLQAKDILVKHMLEHGRNITKDIHWIREISGSDYKRGLAYARWQKDDALSKIANSLLELVSSMTDQKINVGIRLLKKSNNGELVFSKLIRATSGSRSLDKTEIPLSNSYFSRLVTAPRAIIINDVSQEVGDFTKSEVFNKSYQSCAVAPIGMSIRNENQKELYGFITVDAFKENVLTDEVLPILDFYANWCALVVSEIPC